MQSDTRISNSGFARLRKQLTEAERELAELRSWKAREDRVRQAYAMAKAADLPTTYEGGGDFRSIFLETARNTDRDLKEALTEILEVLD